MSKKSFVFLLLSVLLAGLIGEAPAVALTQIPISDVYYTPDYGYIEVTVWNTGDETYYFVPRVYMTYYGWTTLWPATEIEPGDDHTFESWFEETFEYTVVMAYLDPEECASVEFLSHVEGGAWYGDSDTACYD